MKKKQPANTWLWRFARNLLARPFIKIRNIHSIGIDKIPPPPYLLIGNHTHVFDPLFVGGLIKEPVSWVAARGGFQTIYLAPLLKLLGAIAKQKGVPDAMTIRQIYTTLKDGGVVGIYPEGTVTWDGNFGTLPKGTEKLLEKVRVPVVAARIHGGYSIKPRWADKNNKGRIEIEFEVFEGKEAIAFLKESEWTWQERTNNSVKGKNKALGLERIAWFCPECKSFKSISAKGNTGKCKACGHEILVDNYMHINKKRIDVFLKNQKTLLEESIEKSKKIEIDAGIAREWDRNTQKYLQKNKGKMVIDHRGLKVGEKLFELEKIKGLTTFIKRIDEFIYEDRIVRIRTEHSSFLIYNALKIFMKTLDGDQ